MTLQRTFLLKNVKRKYIYINKQKHTSKLNAWDEKHLGALWMGCKPTVICNLLSKFWSSLKPLPMLKPESQGSGPSPGALQVWELKTVIWLKTSMCGMARGQYRGVKCACARGIAFSFQKANTSTMPTFWLDTRYHSEVCHSNPNTVFHCIPS